MSQPDIVHGMHGALEHLRIFATTLGYKIVDIRTDKTLVEKDDSTIHNTVLDPAKQLVHATHSCVATNMQRAMLAAHQLLEKAEAAQCSTPSSVS